MVETGHEARAHGGVDLDESREVADRRSQLLTGALFGGGILAAAGIAGAFETLFASPAFAASPTDVQILQTASSIEVLAVATYKTALTLPFIGGSSANPVVKAFATTTMEQHSQHLAGVQRRHHRPRGQGPDQPRPGAGQGRPGRGARADLPGSGGGAGAGAGAGGGRDLRGRRGRAFRRQCQKGHRLDHGGGGPTRLDPAGRTGPAGCQRRPAHRPASQCRPNFRPPPDPSGSPTRSIPPTRPVPATEGALS